MQETATGREIMEYGLSETPLTEDVAAELRQLIEMWKLASMDNPAGGETESAAIGRFQTIIKLRWGEEGLRMLTPPENRPEETPANATVELTGEEEVAESVTMSLTQAKPPQLRARLRRLFATGRCSREQFVRMSLAPPQRVRTLLSNNEPIPAGSFRDAAELSVHHAKRIADWATGRGRK